MWSPRGTFHTYGEDIIIVEYDSYKYTCSPLQ